MFSIFPIIGIYSSYNEKTTNKSYLLIKQLEFVLFCLFGSLWGLHYGCFEKHDDSLYHFFVPVQL